MSTLQERMAQAKAHYESVTGNKFKNTELANFVGVSKVNVGLWFKGPTQELEGSNLLKAAAYLRVNSRWLAGEKAPMVLDRPSLDNNIDLSQKISIEGRPVPVISWVAAGSFDPIETVLKDVEVDEYLPPIRECGKNGYGLVVVGNSMKPDFKPGDRIYVNPDIQTFDLQTDDLVIIACCGESEATFKKLIIEGGDKYLQPLNPDWPEQIIKLTEDCRLVGKVVGLYRKI
jgi:SOS-response transcriptional repressor LexA